MELTRSDTDERALSPVVGTALLLVITVLLVSVSAVLIFGATEEKPTAPAATLQLEAVEGSDDYVIEMTAGDTVDGDRLTLYGVEDPDTLAGSTLVAGTRVRVTPGSDRIRVVWTEDAGEPVTYTLRTFELEQSDGESSGAAGFADGTVFTGSSGDIISVAGDGGATSTLVGSGSVEGVGSAGPDVTGDGSENLPFVTSGEAVKVVDADGDVTTVADSSDIDGSIENSKTRLAVGSWNGSPNSVFFVNQSHEAIYRATPSGTPQVAVDLNPGNGAQAVAGPADIDDDGDDELVFADSSQTIRYVEPGGTVQSTGVTAASNNGIGSGAVGTLDGYSGEVVTTVEDSGQNVTVVNASGGDIITASETSGSGAPLAKKAPTTLADIDDDGDNELVYVGNANGKIKYLDNFGGTITKEFLRDDGGNRIDGSSDTGVG